ncbi:MAG: helix-turn-helix domain-containing protein [Chloroflexota bacterium]|nr:MAG: helix-turn-helix domain-containing protein [Chloroflexota bacterium]
MRTGVRELRRRQRWLRSAIGRQLLELREEAGGTRAATARAANIDPAHLLRIEAGSAQASLEAIVSVADVLGADVSVRLFPSRPPRIRDRFQAPIVESLIRLLGREWRAEPEVSVREPSRGVVDLVISSRSGRPAIAVEVHSELRSVEAILRRAAEKAEGVRALGRFGPEISKLLVIRSTVRTREIARQFSATLAAAYPVSATAAYRALAGHEAGWPGPAILWSDVSGASARILDRAPRRAKPVR